ncbi:hypothetical protein W97_01143 [Coniosporium apollinis CBS 100218]|uniref:ELMO domain-containing protein n=1 Tax=Coniosporium apollinis (strain CBS 100218) TaxID=1168221 RepID=R7YJ38_CONA1|nr:uncharacterized protein W97_01143 [Coniosporium apollinis CBS 100218]EON61925.1 hypothetical protein W97_01143 [Coniosporium apollinis CBS 100218]
MDNTNISELVERLSSDEDSVRKMAAFKLQSAIGDPSFADAFIHQGGLPKLRFLALHANGNTLAYSLTSFSRLLELDIGWDHVTQDLIERVVELVVTHPLVNILRGAMSILVAVVSHPHNRTSQPGAFGFRALKPAVAVHPQFLEMLVSRLSSADHALCANALQLINALMRDAITSDADTEWPKFIKRLQDLGVIKAVYVLMQSTALQDLAHPILEFQSLTKTLLRKWRDVRIDLDKPEHRRALKGLHLASNPPSKPPVSRDGVAGSAKHHPEKWRRLGFETESPAWEFEETGFLGMMDLTDFVRKNEDGFQKLLLEQSTKPAEQRCPIAKASLAVTGILHEHFEIDKPESDEGRYAMLESKTGLDRAFKPLLLQWSRLHTSGLNAFLRLWKATGAEVEDFEKVEELVRILVEQVVGQAPRTRDVQDVEDELADFEYRKLRDLQMELLELTYEDAWGHHLQQLRDELHHEAQQFIREQRIRCLLSGAWFPHALSYPSSETGPISKAALARTVPSIWRFVRLSHNRRYLHFADFDARTEEDESPALESLPNKIDLSTVVSVASNISTDAAASAPSSSGSDSTIRTGTAAAGNNGPGAAHTKITITGYEPSSSSSSSSKTPDSQRREMTLLELHPPTQTLAAEWLDGLLMLLNQQPLTADTAKLIRMIEGYGLKIRLLNVRFEDLRAGEEPELPGREGTEGPFWYALGEEDEGIGERGGGV